MIAYIPQMPMPISNPEPETSTPQRRCFALPTLQLAEVYYVEGLGPAKGDTALQYMLAPGGTLAPGGLAAGRNIPGLPQIHPHSFADQVRGRGRGTRRSGHACTCLLLLEIPATSAFQPATLPTLSPPHHPPLATFPSP